MITACPSCDKKLKAPDGAEGRKIRCPSCSTTLVVTEDGVEPYEAATRTKPERARRRDEDDDAPRKVRRRADPDDEDEEEDDRPSRRRGARKRSGGGIPLWVWLTGGGVLVAALILVLVLVLSGGDNYAKVKEGMTEAEVTKLLGKPTQSVGVGNTKFLQWVDSKSAIQVTIQDGKVANKAKLDAKSFDVKGF